MRTSNQLKTTKLLDEEIKTQDQRSHDYEDPKKLGNLWNRLFDKFTASKISHRKGLLLSNGCGTGQGIELYKDFQIIGTDISQQMLKKASTRIGKTVIRCNSEELPVKDNVFDVVTLNLSFINF